MKKTVELYQGKAKTLFATEDPNYVITVFRDDTSRFNGEKIEKLAGKGKLNNHFNAYIMQYLASHGVATHFERVLADNESLMKRLQMVPVEAVVRNRAAGSMCKRLGVARGKVFAPPVFEYFYKSDALGDPMINEDHIRALGWASAAEIVQMRNLSLQVNELLMPLFAKAGLVLVDFKLEFGRYQGELLLGDEFSPDGCRVWDASTGEVMDKDRFRYDMGDVVEHYQEIARRLGISA